MRKLAGLICFLIGILAFEGHSQSIAIQNIQDSVFTTGDCIKTGDYISFIVKGTSSYKDKKLKLYADYDDGQGFRLEDSTTTDSVGNFWRPVNNTYQNYGNYNVRIAVKRPNGASDTGSVFIPVDTNCKEISGKVYLDQSGDCSLSNNEPLVSNKSVKVLDQNGQLAGYDVTNDTGFYKFNTKPGKNYTVKVGNLTSYKHSCPDSGILPVVNTPSRNLNFGLECLSNKNDFRFSHNFISNGDFRPSRVRKLVFKAEADFQCAKDTLKGIRLVLNKHLTTHDSFYSSVNESPRFTSKNGDTVKWNLKHNTIDSFSFASIPIYTKNSAQIGDTLCIKMILETSQNDYDKTNDTSERCYEVVNSYDPNNKVVSPEGTNNQGFIQNDQMLTYTINFQNTGNAKAFDVRVEDTLDQNLDPSSFEIVGSSHEMDLDIVNNQILKFHFNDINLPDSGSNEPASHGHVQFRMALDSGLSHGTQIKNSAAIFFDQNPPIITNTTLNTICRPVSVDISPKACGQYTSPSEEYTWEQSGLYHDTLKRAGGCDSILNIDLAIQQPLRDTINPAVCGNYESPSGQNTWDQSGMYYDTIDMKDKCDSIITIDLTVHGSSDTVIEPEACDEYVSPSRQYTWNQSGVYYDTLQNSHECDSLITIDLTINSLDTGIERTDNGLKAKDTGANYQWLRCDQGYKPIDNATDQYFTPTSIGDYAVALTKGACSDTSFCQPIHSVGRQAGMVKQGVKIYPNPVQETLRIQFNRSSVSGATYRLNTFTGQRVRSGILGGEGNNTIQMDGLNAGVYLLTIQTKESQYIKRVLVR